MWEFTREEQFIGATTRHPMTTQVKLGAKRDGTLTAMQMRVVSNTGAYGGHGGETLAAALGSPLTGYRCPNKKADGYAVYTNMVPGGRLPRLRRVADDLRHRMRHGRSGASCWAWIRSRSAARTWSGPSDWIESIWKEPVGRRVRQLRARPVPGPRRGGAGQRARRCQARRATSGSRAPASPWPCSSPAADRAPVRRGDAASAPTAAIISPSARRRWATAR